MKTEREIRVQKLTGLESREATDDEKKDGKIGTLTGRAVVYNSRTELWPGMTEEVKPGAFTESLSEDGDVRATFNHDTNLILGRTKPGTLRLQDGPQGLDMEIDVPDTQAGRDLLTSVKRGDVDGASFTFSVRANGQSFAETDGGEHRVLTALNLYELGPVTFPQYTDTTVASRSIQDHRHEIERAASEVKRKNAARSRDLDLLARA